MKLLLRGLFVFFLASVLRPLALAQTAQPLAPAKGMQLNVVFHGLFSYIIWKDHIEVLTPLVPEHVYKAGTWGKELPLREGAVYHLSGVHGEAQAPPIDMENNLVLTNISNIERVSGKLFCSFILPLPRQIIGLRRASPPPQQVAFQGAALSGKNPKSIPLIQVLVYTLEDWPNLGENLPWLSENNRTGTVNLHIWAEPEIDLKGIPENSHAEQAFSRLMALFPGVELQLAFSASATTDKSTHIRGLETWEEKNLVERSKLLFHQKAQNPKATKGTEVSNCVGVLVLNNNP